MTEITKNYRKIIIVLLLAISALAVYLLAIRLAYPVFQNTRLTDPLAELHSLFPLYYIALFLLAVAAVLIFVFRINNRGVQILVLLIFGIMLWYTRYYLAGFSWEPDSARNLGVSLRINDILDGTVFHHSGYGSQFPIPAVLENVIFTVSGMSTGAYFHLIPFVWIIVFVLLLYVFGNSLFSPLTGFLTAFLAMAGMHYMIFITGAHTIGVLLLLTTLVLMFRTGLKWRLLTVALIIVVVLTHPVTPPLLAVFLGAAFIAYISRRTVKAQLIFAGLLVLCLAGWLLWPTLSTLAPDALGVTPPASDIPSRLIPRDFHTTILYLFGSPFVFDAIYTLNKVVYGVYILFILAVIGTVIGRTQRKNISWLVTTKQLGGLSRSQWFLIICSPILVVAAALLAETEHALIERGLTLAILTMSGVIASVAVAYWESGGRIFRRVVGGLAVSFVLFVTMTFPVITYSIDAYSSFPKSEEKGLEFISENIYMNDKVFISSFSQQIILYQPLTKNTLLVNKDNIIENGDVFALRSTGFYYAAIRNDVSFTDNRWLNYKAMVESSTAVNAIYYSPTMQVFLKR